MKKLSFYLIAFLMIPAVILTSCKEEATKDPAFDVLKSYLIAEGMDLDHVIKNADGAKFVTAAPDSADLQTFLDKYYMMDIRAEDAFNAGHIDGANLVAFANILTAAESAGDKPILVICYTGQTACYATALLRLYGYHDAQALKWGMSGWSPTTSGSWDNNIGNIAEGDPNWSYDAAPTNVTYSAPDWTATSEDGAGILKERVEAVVAAGFTTDGGKVSGADVLASPGNYFINNYFSDADYTGFGHIAGAYRINPLLLNDESILNLDPDAKVVTYCYTGQTSAVVTAFLNVMGYDAYSLLFGMNGLYNSNTAWSANQWGVSGGPKDLPVVQ